jgi:hypothetical protein
VLGRRKATKDPEPATLTGPGKNRPTPKRREVEAARKQPLVPVARSTSTARPGRGASKEVRAAAREERTANRQRMMAGEERFLGPRDRGPVRRYVRELVDSRRNIGEYLLPVMLVVLLLSFVGSSLQRQNPAVYTGILVLTYLIVVVALVDAFWLHRKVKNAVTARFGAPEARGLTLYAVMRAFQMRRSRIPRPTVERGQPPA